MNNETMSEIAVQIVLHGNASKVYVLKPSEGLSWELDEQHARRCNSF
jgi:hypothetical protein